MECSGSQKLELPWLLSRITSSMSREVWSRELAGHPDRTLAEVITQGIALGFRVGFDPSRVTLKAKGSNMQSAAKHEEVVSAYLADEMEAGKVVLAGTPQEAQAMDIHCSPFRVIPKSKLGKFRLIVNLSAPEGSSANDGIRKELASLSYVSVDEVAEAVGELGRGTLMAKMNIRQAYRHIPVHPQDRFLLGMMWHMWTLPYLLV